MFILQLQSAIKTIIYILFLSYFKETIYIQVLR